jgi:hypothetical protein
MKGEINKFDEFSQIYSSFSEKNKTSILKAAETLLAIQRTNGGFADSEKGAASLSAIEGGECRRQD